MFTWLKNITSTSAIAEKAVNAIINTGDALVYTSEEQAKDSATKLQFAIEWLKQSSAQNLARRYIALLLTVYFLATISVLMFFGIYSPNSPQTTFLQNFVSDFLLVPFNGIMAFYFMTHLLRGVKK